jgi:hypothetical protein
MRDIARAEGHEHRAEESLARYRAIDREVYASLEADENALVEA